MICSSFRLDTELTTYTKATKATPGACAPSAHHTQTHIQTRILARSLCMLMRQGTFDGSKHTAGPLWHPEGGAKWKKKRKRRDMFSTLQGLWKNYDGCEFFFFNSLKFMSYPTSFAEMLPRRMRSLLPRWHHRIWIVTPVATSLYCILFLLSSPSCWSFHFFPTSMNPCSAEASEPRAFWGQGQSRTNSARRTGCVACWGLTLGWGIT